MVRFMEAIDRDRRVRVLVAHPSQQHSYQLASALKLNDELGLYATTVYDSPRSITRIVSQVLKGGLQRRADVARILRIAMCSSAASCSAWQNYFACTFPLQRDFICPLGTLLLTGLRKRLQSLLSKNNSML